jgi:hypothetical protein
MAINTAFNPAYTQGASISVTTTTASATLGKGAKSLYLLNTGDATCFVRVGPAGTVATVNDLPVPAGFPIVIGKDQDHDTVAAITASATATLLVIPGEGKL